MKTIKAIIIKATRGELNFDKAVNLIREIDKETAKEYAKSGLECAVTSGFLTLKEVSKLVDTDTYCDLEDIVGVTSLTLAVAEAESSLYQSMDSEDFSGIEYYSRRVSIARENLGRLLESLGGEI